ncbi:peptidase family M13 [Oesophagostomum dentatum]|uniref:Peptidase family M13 n=1 Tax=Oesophagostomum dentatum TaxID=61180 RepID=A0A0B1TKJ9_OESDE|nr:peptidase family M13 [Oesophagostomum dentatum]
MSVLGRYLEVDDGIMRDEKGNRSWLPKEFKHEYNKREACLKRKYSNSEVPGTYLKPRGGLTVEEDFADSEGVKLAYRAYKNAQKHFVNEPRLSDVSDLTSDQLFFIGWASFFCRNLGEDNREMINMLKEDYYSVPILRYSIHSDPSIFRLTAQEQQEIF